VRKYVDLYFGEFTTETIENKFFKARLSMPRDINAKIREFRDQYGSG